MLQITVAGRLVKDSIMRFTADGKPVLNFTVACDVGFGDSKHGVFIGCSLWGKRGESLEPYMKKGASVTVTGGGDLRKWDSDKGSGSEISCNVSEVTLQGGKQSSESAPAQQSGFRNTPAEDKSTPQDGGFDTDSIPF